MPQELWNPAKAWQTKQEKNIHWLPLEYFVHSKVITGGQVVYALIKGIEESSTVDVGNQEVMEAVNRSLHDKQFIDSQGQIHPLHLGILYELGRLEMARKRKN